MRQRRNIKGGFIMAEKEKKDEREIIPAVREFDNTKTVVTKVGSGKGAKVVYEVLFPIPDTDEECIERYGANKDYIFAAGIRQLTYRVDYPSVGFNDDGSLKDGGHEAMQTLADGYKVGRQVVSTKTAEAKAAKATHDKLKGMAEGGDVAALLAKIAEAKAKGLI
jgi:hypothetical protein